MNEEINYNAISKADFKKTTANRGDSDAIVRPSISYWRNVVRRLKKNKVAVLTLAAILIVSLMAVFAPILSQYSYDTTNPANKNLKPSAEHLFGTDSVGRDLRTRVWVGARVSLLIGLGGAAIPQIIGIIIGGVSGYFGGMVDVVIMRIIDIGICIPQLIYITFIMLFIGAGPSAIIIAISMVSWMGGARGVRARMLQFRNREFVMAARTLGASPRHVIFRCILPNIMGQQVVGISQAIPGAIFTEAYLSFIGLGVQSPMTSLGQLSQIGSTVFRVHPYQLALPSVVICMTILAFYLFGNCLRDALDPHMVN